MLAFHTEERRDAMLTYVIDLYADDLEDFPDAEDLFSTIDFKKHIVAVLGKPIKLTHTEFKILELLTEKPGWVYSRDQLLDHLQQLTFRLQGYGLGRLVQTDRHGQRTHGRNGLDASVRCIRMGP